MLFVHGMMRIPRSVVGNPFGLFVSVQVLFNPDKQNVVAYNEKFQRSKFSPTVSLFGHKPVDGWMAVTSSGMVRLSNVKV